eukprot:4454391-Ditylum_brightwellii.AAC.1
MTASTLALKQKNMDGQKQTKRKLLQKEPKHTKEKPLRYKATSAKYRSRMRWILPKTKQKKKMQKLQSKSKSDKQERRT